MAASRGTLLTGLRVLELAGGTAAAFGARLLAATGADVVRVEPPGGDPARDASPRADAAPRRSLAFYYRNAGKRCVALDLRDARDLRELDRLLRATDVVVCTLSEAELQLFGLDASSLAHRYPSLIVVDIRPFGLTGPAADRHAENVNTWHSTGMGWMTRAPLGDEAGLPLLSGGYQADYFGGLHVAASATAALHERARSGRGQFVELSQQELLLSMLFIPVGYYFEAPEDARRPTSGPPLAGGMRPCKDGYVLLSTFTEQQWEAVIQLMGAPDWSAGDWWRDAEARRLSLDFLDQRISEWVAENTRYDIVNRSQAAHLPAATLATPADIVVDRQIVARRFVEFVTDEQMGSIPSPGLPFRLSPEDVPTAAPYPELVPLETVMDAARTPPAGQQPSSAAPRGASAGPLSGLRVADFSWSWAGPYLGGMLADMGADVIKVESMTRPDLIRVNPPLVDGRPGMERAYGHYWSNRGKRSLALDLKTDAGRDLALRLIARSNVVLENFSPGAMERLGLGYEAARNARPDVVYLSLSGFGATGPNHSWLAFGTQMMLHSSFVSLTGLPDREPTYLRVPYPDPAGGTMGAFAILGALDARRRTGEGCHIDLSQFETLVSVLPEAVLDQLVNGRTQTRRGNSDPDMAPHGVYPCAGYEQWVAIAVTDDATWARLAEAVGNPAWLGEAAYASLPGRKAQVALIDDGLSSWTRERSRDDVVAVLQRASIAATPVLSIPELFEDPHLRERGYFEDVAFHEGGSITVGGLNWRLSRTPGAIRSTAPTLGQHSLEVLREVVGLTDEEIATATSAGALR